MRDLNGISKALSEDGFRTLAVAQSAAIIGRPNTTYGSGARFPLRRIFSSIAEDAGELENSGSVDAGHCFVGHDFGSDVVREAVVYGPSGVAANVGRPKALVLISPLADQVKSPVIKQNVDRVFNGLLTPWARWSAAEQVFFAPGRHLPKTWKRGWSKEAGYNKFWERDSRTLTEWSDTDQIPVLAVIGQENAMYEVNDIKASLERQDIQNIEYHFVEKSGQALLPEQPDVLIKVISDFLTTHCRG